MVKSSNASNDHRRLGQTTTFSDMVSLLPFYVEIRRLDTNTAGDVNMFALTDIVTEWLSEYFENVELGGDESATFEAIVLDTFMEDSQSSRELQPNNDRTSVSEVYFEGVTVWTRQENVPVWSRQGNEVTPTETEVADIQIELFDNDQQQEALLNALQAAEPSAGLGNVVVDVEASISMDGESLAISSVMPSSIPQMEPTASPSSSPEPPVLTRRPTEEERFEMPSPLPSGAPSTMDALVIMSNMPSTEDTVAGKESQVPTSSPGENSQEPTTSMPMPTSDAYSQQYSHTVLYMIVGLSSTVMALSIY